MVFQGGFFVQKFGALQGTRGKKNILGSDIITDFYFFLCRMSTAGLCTKLFLNSTNFVVNETAQNNQWKLRMHVFLC